MELLSSAEVISLSKNEKGILQLSSTAKESVIPFKEIKSETKGSIFHKPCFSCKNPSKYRCPKCSIFSCSLQCVKLHKENNNCDGQRERTNFVAKEEFKDSHLHSDFHFLEDIHRNIDLAQRGKKGIGLGYGKLPLNLYRLQTVARLRKTNLRILPLVFSKRKRSTTYLRYSDNKIFWRLEWEFPHDEYSCVDERVDEATLLGDCLDKYLNGNSENTVEKLSCYQLLQPLDIAVLLKDENCPSNITQYHLLEQRETLKSNFRHKTIIEYPSLLVVSKLHLGSYKLVL